jgi:hypothetical protein
MAYGTFLPGNFFGFSSILQFSATKLLHNFQDQRYRCVKEHQNLPVASRYFIVDGFTFQE